MVAKGLGNTMTELNLGLASERIRKLTEGERKTPGRWRRPVTAVLLSALFPGLGQLYNRQPRKGLAIAATVPLFFNLVGFTRILLSFPGFVAFVVISNTGFVFVLVDAARTSWKQSAVDPQVSLSRTMTLVIGLLIVAFALLSIPELFLYTFPNVRAFCGGYERIPNEDA
jgi:TM2 domain-containing membrane protein YozV